MGKTACWEGWGFRGGGGVLPFSLATTLKLAKQKHPPQQAEEVGAKKKKPILGYLEKDGDRAVWTRHTHPPPTPIFGVPEAWGSRTPWQPQPDDILVPSTTTTPLKHAVTVLGDYNVWPCLQATGVAHKRFSHTPPAPATSLQRVGFGGLQGIFF